MSEQSFDFEKAFRELVEIKNLLYFFGMSLDEIAELSHKVRFDDVGSMQALCVDVIAMIEPLQGLHGIIDDTNQALLEKIREGRFQ